VKQTAAVSLGKTLHAALTRRSNQKPKWGNPMSEDSFEKARKAFFRTATTTPQPIMPPAEFLTPQNDAVAQQVSPAPREAVASKFC